MRIDLHVHSTYSRDGTATPAEIVRMCRRLGLGGLAITDHNAVAGAVEAQSIGRDEGILIIPGTEVSSSDGHILAYGVRECIPRGLSASETVDRIRSMGGVAVAAHPVRFPSGIGLEVAKEVGFDAIEVLNGGSSSRANRSATRLAERLGRTITGGSDAHKQNEVGRSYTVVEGAFTEDQVLKALRDGSTEVGGRSRTMSETVVYSAETLIEWLRGGMSRL